MKLAWKEIRYFKHKYLLIEAILILMIFMVIFLSGLTNGLGRAVSAAIDDQEVTTYLLSDEATGILSASSVDRDVYEDLLKEGSAVSPFNVQRSSIIGGDGGDKLDIQWLALEEKSFLYAPLAKGSDDLGMNEEGIYGVVIDGSFQDDGIKLGTLVEESASGMILEVRGFVDQAQYAHSAVGYISLDAFKAINKRLNPNYVVQYNALAFQNETPDLMDGYTIYNQEELIQKIPGYAAEQTTLQMIQWVLLAISAAILGVFFYVITLQKLKQFGVLKAVGMSMRQIRKMLLSQIFLIGGIGVVTGTSLALLFSMALPNSMPFYLESVKIVVIMILFLVVSIVTGLFSIVTVGRIDPMTIIGGNEQ